MAISPQNNLIHAENTPHIGLDGRGLGFEHPEIRLWCLFWQSVKWGAPCGSCPKMTFNGLEPPSHRQNAQVKLARVMGARYGCVLEDGIIFYLGLIGVGSSTVRCRTQLMIILPPSLEPI